MTAGVGDVAGAPPDAERRIVDDLVRSYLDRFPGAEFAHRRDALYRHQLQTLRYCLALVDMGLQDEGIELEARVRVIRGALQAAAPDPDTAGGRVARTEAATRELSLRGRVPPGQGTPG